jgi:hypothetical protein
MNNSGCLGHTTVLHTGMCESASFPGGASTAVSLTVDVDAEAGWLGEGAEYSRRLTILSEGRYGVVRGIPRILELLRRYEIPATFFWSIDGGANAGRTRIDIDRRGHITNISHFVNIARCSTRRGPSACGDHGRFPGVMHCVTPPP